MAGRDALDLQHGFHQQPHLVVRDFGRENLGKATFHLLKDGHVGIAKAEEFSVVAANDRKVFLFLCVTRLTREDNDFLTVKSLGRRFGLSNFSPSLANLAQASSAMTTTVAAWAMHRSRAVVAKSSFSWSSANEAGTNMSGPPSPIKKSVGDIFPQLRIQNWA